MIHQLSLKLTHSFSVEKNPGTRIGRIKSFYQSWVAIAVASHEEIGAIKLEHREATVVMGHKNNARAFPSFFLKIGDSVELEMVSLNIRLIIINC